MLGTQLVLGSVAYQYHIISYLELSLFVRMWIKIDGFYNKLEGLLR